MAFDIEAARERLSRFDPIIRHVTPIKVDAPKAARSPKGPHITPGQWKIIGLLREANDYLPGADMGSFHCVANQIMEIRRKVGRRVIHSIQGKGYRLTKWGDRTIYLRFGDGPD